VKYTVPPDTFEPEPVVGDVNPGPLVGTLVGVDPDAELVLFDDDDDPHAAATSTTTPTPINPNNLRPKLPMLTILTNLRKQNPNPQLPTSAYDLAPA
jgi:hypothetical protein